MTVANGHGMSLRLLTAGIDMQPNYMRVWAGLFTLVIYLRPAAVVGVAVAAGVAYFNLGLSTGSYQLEPEVRLSLLHVEVARCTQGLSSTQTQQMLRDHDVAQVFCALEPVRYRFQAVPCTLCCAEVTAMTG